MKQLRQQLEEVLGLPLRDETWRFLVERHYVRKVLEGEMLVSDLAVEVRSFQRAFGQPVHAVTGTEEPSGAIEPVSPRGEILARVLGLMARRDGVVERCRKAVLDTGVPLQPQQCETWIRNQAREEGPPTLWFSTNVPLPPEVAALLSEGARVGKIVPANLELDAEQVSDTARFHLLRYQDGADGPELLIPTTGHGKLETLREGAEHVSRTYGFSEAQGSYLILTGQSPKALPPVEAHILSKEHLPVLTRVLLQVDPAVAPRELADYYGRFRARVVGSRYRDLSPKHLELGYFSAATESSRRLGETWADTMQEWNSMYGEEHPDWRYDQVSNFARDCTQALRRLLHPPYHRAGTVEV